MRHAADTQTASAGRGLAAFSVAGVFVVALGLVLASGYINGRAFYDQDLYHLKVIRTFANEWPQLNLRDYAAVTTPGYHIILALLSRGVSDDVTFLRIAGSLFTIGLLATLGWVVARRTSPATAIALCLPFLASLYTFSSGAWLLPDNAGWWGVVLTLAIALDGRWTSRTYVLAGLVLLGVVLIRQVHLWCAGVLVVAAWLDGPDRSAVAASGNSGRFARALVMLAAAVPAVIAVGIFMLLWGGTMPPSMRDAIYHGYQPAEAGVRISGPNFATPGAILAIAGVTGLFFLGFLAPAFRAGRVTAKWILVGAVTGFLIGTIPHSSYEFGTRSSGFWNLIRVLPTLGPRSPLFIGLATLGGAVLAAWAQALERRDAWIFGAAYTCFIASPLPNPSAFQRYFEPFVLIAWALAAPRVPAAIDSRTAAWRFAGVGPLVLAAMLATVTLLSLRPGPG